MEKQIGNPGQAFSLGATWGTPSVDNAMTTEIAPLINGTTTTLYTGDIVALDATGTQAILPTTATLNACIGTVGSSLELGSYTGTPSSGIYTPAFPTIDSNIGMTTGLGSFQPQSNTEWTTQTVGFTNGSANLTDALVSTNNPLTVGLLVYTPYNSSTNSAPQVFQIASNGGSSGSWTAVGVVVSGAGTTFTGTTGSFSCQVGRDFTSIGPGWSPPAGWTSASAFAPGIIVPVITRGFGRVNINGLTGIIAGDFVIATNASVVGARVAIGSLTAAQQGYTIAVTLEAYAARDYSLLSYGISGHDSVRALINMM